MVLMTSTIAFLGADTERQTASLICTCSPVWLQHGTTARETAEQRGHGKVAALLLQVNLCVKLRVAVGIGTTSYT